MKPNKNIEHTKRKKGKETAEQLLQSGLRIPSSVEYPDGSTHFTALEAKVNLAPPSKENGKRDATFIFENKPENKNKINAAVRASIEKAGGLQKINIIEIDSSVDEKKVKLQIEQMIVDLNKEAIKTGGVEYDVKMLPKDKTIRFLVQPLEAVISLMSPKDFEKQFEKNKKKDAYKPLYTALTKYTTSENLQKLGENNDTPENIAKAVAEHQTLLNAAQDLKNSLQPDDQASVDPLIKQIEYSHPLRRFNALDVATSTQGDVLGFGSKGAVFARHFKDGFMAAVKLDSKEATGPAIAAGIDPENPQESRRAVVAYGIDRVLGLGVIPETRFVTQVDQGTMRLGSAMEVVHGAVGQRFVQGDALSEREMSDFIKNWKSNGFESEAAIKTNDKYEVVWNEQAPRSIVEVYKRSVNVIDVNYNNGALQKELSNLQLLDNIIGAADRHPGNWIYVKDGLNNFSVKGIDNDDAHGAKWEEQDWQWKTVDKQKGKEKFPANWASKTPSIPPFIDIEAAIKILQVDRKAIEAQLALLPAAEKTAELARFDKVREIVVKRVNEGFLASDTGNTTPEQSKALQKAGGTLLSTHMQILGQLTCYQWGLAITTKMHERENSYLGEVLARKAAQGTAPAEFK